MSNEKEGQRPSHQARCDTCGSHRPHELEQEAALDTVKAYLDDPTALNVEAALKGLMALEEPSWVDNTPSAHLSLLDRALGAGTEISAPLRAHALVARGRVAWRAGRIETSELDLEQAAELAMALGDRAIESQAKRFLAHVRLLRGRLSEARALASEARAIAMALSDPYLEALAVSVLGYQARLSGETALARELLQSAIATFMSVGERRFDSSLRIDVVFTYLDAGDYPTAALYAQRLLTNEAVGVHRARLEICLGHVALMSDAAVVAEAHYRRASEQARAAGDFAREISAIACIAVALFEQGRTLDARVELLELLPAARRFGHNLFSGMFAVVLAVVECTLGNYREARALIDGAEREMVAGAFGLGVFGLALSRALIDFREASAIDPQGKNPLDAWANEMLSAELATSAQVAVRWLIESRILFQLLSTAIEAGLPSVPQRRLMRVHAEGRWFELCGTQRVHCGGRRVMRKLLVALAQAYTSTPAKQLSANELIEVGWPGERMTADSGKNRLNVMLTRMRNLGLRDVLCGDDAGYTLTSNVVLELVSATTP